MIDFEIPYLNSIEEPNKRSELINNLEPFLWLWRYWKCSPEHFKNRNKFVLPEAFYLRNHKGEKTISLFEMDDKIKCEVSLEALLFMQFLIREKSFELSNSSVPVCLIRSRLLENLQALSLTPEHSITIAKTPLTKQQMIAHHWDIISDNMHLFYSVLAKSSIVIYQNQDQDLSYKKLLANLGDSKQTAVKK